MVPEGGPGDCWGGEDTVLALSLAFLKPLLPEFANLTLLFGVMLNIGLTGVGGVETSASRDSSRSESVVFVENEDRGLPV